MKSKTIPGRHVESTALGRTLTLRSFPLFVTIVLATVFLFAGQSLTKAEMIVAVTEAQLLPGDSGFLDVYFMVSDETESLAAYQVELILSGPDSGVRFVDFAESANAVFPGSTPAQTASRPALPGGIAAANDILLSGENLIEDGAGIMRVLFETDPGSLGVYNVEIDTNIVRTNFSNGSGGLITIDQFIGGTITVVPEPSALFLLIGGSVFVFTIRTRRTL